LNWQPTASHGTLQQRAQMYQTIRAFFAMREVLEVETPILSAGSVPEPTIAPLQTTYHHTTDQQLFLQTSPELAMKRLLAAGSGPIYQIAKAFRDDEVGRYHNPEFTLLEWYRPDFEPDDLIQEISELLQQILACPPAKTITYCNSFQQYLYLNPLTAPLTDLQNHAQQCGFTKANELDRTTCLQFLFSRIIEPRLGQTQPIVVKDFPIEQAALARQHPTQPQLAARFEVFYQGIELANGFHELTDPQEQQQRFAADLATRQRLNLPTYPLDQRFLAALQAGLPDCSGVAMGLDRLLMLKLNADHIHQVLAFPIDNA